MSTGNSPEESPPSSGYTAAGLLKNSVLVAGSHASTAVMALLYVLVARVLGDAGFGDFMLALTIAAILGVIQGWGRNRYSAIMAARDPQRSSVIVAENLGASLPLTLIYLLAVAGVAFLLTARPLVVLVSLLLAVDLAVAAYSKLLRLIFRVHDIYQYDTLGVLAERVAVGMVAAVALLTRPTPVTVALAFLVGRTAGAVITSSFYVRRVGMLGLKFDQEVMGRLFRAGTPLALRGGLNSLNLRADMLILGSFRSPAEVGWYGAVYKLLDGLMMLPSVILGSLGPHLSANFGGGRHEVVKRLLQRGMKYLLFAGGLLSTALLILAESLVVFLFGDSYAPAVPALRILSIAVVLGFLRLLVIEVLDNVDEREATVKIFAVAVALNVGLNLALVPQYGIIGAAWCTVASETVLTIALLFTLRSDRYRVEFVRMAAPVAVGMVAAGAVMWLLQETPFMAALGGGLVYFATLSVLRFWDKKDRDLAILVWQGMRPPSG